MHSEIGRSGLRGRNLSQRLRVAVMALVAMLACSPCFAHPMGNFSISHYAGITIEPGSLEVRYLVDMAEIPTFQEMQQAGINARLDDPKLVTYLKAKSNEFALGLNVSVEGRELPLVPVSQNVIFPPGAGGLPTMKFGFLYRATIAEACNSGGCRLNYEDGNFPGRAGWKEIVVNAGREITLANSTAPEHDRSSQLSNYPTDMVNSPPQALQASATFSAAAATASSSSAPAPRGLLASIHSPMHSVKTTAATLPATATSGSDAAPVHEGIDIVPNQQKTPRSAFTELIATQKIGIGIALLAALIAAGLGALHALEPGHGKTIVAAYLVGAKGTARHAFLLGMIVTTTHTAGVYLLGAITLYAQKYILPEKLYPFLGVLSGLLIAGMGFYIFLQRYAGTELGHSHAHGGVVHSHGGFFHSHGPAGGEPNEALTTHEGVAAGAKQAIPARQLLLLGVTGGIVPCPAALVVLLSALALHRVLFGLFLIVAFSSGLAVVLIAMGMAAVYAGRLMSRVHTEGPLIQRWLPLTSAVTITAFGCVIALRGLMAAGIVQIHV